MKRSIISMLRLIWTSLILQVQKQRENYNKPKSENSRQPGCPSESPISEADLNATNDMPPTKGRGRYICEEKVKAIQDALRHFQMI